MKNESLLFFETPYCFFDFFDSLGLYGDWKILDGLMNERGKKIEDKEYTRFFRNLFKSKDFFRKEVSIAEIISWLDNLSLVKRLFLKLRNAITLEEFKNIQISVEYMIQMSKKMRIDYVFLYRNKALLLEMRTVCEFSKIRPTWSKKFHELIIYKELMGYYLSNLDIRLYALISLYEYEGRKRIEKHYNNNENQLDYLVEYMKRYLIT